MALPNGAIIEKVYEIIDIGIGVIPALTDDNILLIYESNITAINYTTIPLLSSGLNAAYPSAKTGFKAQCINIPEGGLMYEKSGSGWIQYDIVNVT